MATYVTSDAHGHLRALDAALALAGPGDHDRIIIMGDLIDRGPDPVAALSFAKDLPGAQVLLGNHEQMMLDALFSGDAEARFTWEANGGWTTSQALDRLDRTELIELIDWVGNLPLFAVVEVNDVFSCPVRHWGREHSVQPGEALRTYVLAHAGIHAARARAYLKHAGVSTSSSSELTHSVLYEMMAAQDPFDLLWIREDFWSQPTGLVDSHGRGPVVVAGHTPTVLLAGFASCMAGSVLDVQEHAQIIEVGACQDTGGIADRIDIDASAAAGYPFGQVAVMRLEDHRVWYAPVAEGE
ncbi:metallophosphoesterase [Collinsella sp. AGMB00827]|uniref:Metallophosphoesterase n=1 Tax=Collinsella ureilytica TaxID=2869515 RepID=A0ABS7MI56_9ACTN|nr:metallophosphoesterase [Collinsella urealyticum]MBY4796927.1 metallophosphoesterase [Collinsella urealyticum]